MIWLIGRNGMLGSEVERQIKNLGFEYSATDMDVDITSPSALGTHASEIFADKSPRWIINCSAYTAVDKAEDEPELAAMINTEGVKNIAECASEYDAKIIHISTDYVFNGMSNKPLTEEMQTDPIGVYGRTKLDGEIALKNAAKRFFIIRTAWLYGFSGTNFVYTMIKLMRDRGSISVVNDQQGSPTNAFDLAGFIMHIVKSGSDSYGIYHYSNEGKISWYDFAVEIYSLARLNGLLTTECSINPCASEQFPTKARRPSYSLLSKQKVRSVFGINIPGWKESLKNFISEIEEII